MTGFLPTKERKKRFYSYYPFSPPIVYFYPNFIRNSFRINGKMGRRLISRILARLFTYKAPEGVIAAYGGQQAGWSFFIVDQRLHFTLTWKGQFFTISSQDRFYGHNVQVKIFPSILTCTGCGRV